MANAEVDQPTVLEDDIIEWLNRFERERWSGSLTLHFNQGMIQAYEPKPNLRTTNVVS